MKGFVTRDWITRFYIQGPGPRGSRIASLNIMFLVMYTGDIQKKFGFHFAVIQMKHLVNHWQSCYGDELLLCVRSLVMPFGVCCKNV